MEHTILSHAVAKFLSNKERFIMEIEVDENISQSQTKKLAEALSVLMSNLVERSLKGQKDIVLVKSYSKQTLSIKTIKDGIFCWKQPSLVFSEV